MGLINDHKAANVKGIFQNAQNRYILMSKKNKKNSKGWMHFQWLTRKGQDNIKVKEKAYNCAKAGDRSEYKEQKRMTKRLIRREKLECRRKLARDIKTDSKRLYKYFKKSQQSEHWSYRK